MWIEFKLKEYFGLINLETICSMQISVIDGDYQINIYYDRMTQTMVGFTKSEAHMIYIGFSEAIMGTLSIFDGIGSIRPLMNSVL